MSAANANLGLFGSRKLVDLRIPTGKPGVEGAKALEAYAANPSPDNVTLVTLPRLDRAAQASAWFAALAGGGVTIAVQPLERDELPRWIAARLARQNQRAAARRWRSSPSSCEGNLLAARQEIEKLALLLPEGELALDAVERAVADVARYDVFQLSEAWLAGDAARALRILAALRGEGEAVTLAVWQLGEDLHALARVRGRGARRHAACRRAAQRPRLGQAAGRDGSRRTPRHGGIPRSDDGGRRPSRRAVQRHRSRQCLGRARGARAGAGREARAPARRLNGRPPRRRTVRPW